MARGRVMQQYGRGSMGKRAEQGIGLAFRGMLGGVPKVTRIME